LREGYFLKLPLVASEKIKKKNSNRSATHLFANELPIIKEKFHFEQN